MKNNNLQCSAIFDTISFYYTSIEYPCKIQNVHQALQ